MISTATTDHTYALLPKDQEEQINQLIEEVSSNLDADLPNPDLTYVVHLWSQLNQQNNIIEQVNDLWTASHGENTDNWDFNGKTAPPKNSAPSPDLTGEIDFPSSMPLAQSTPIKRNPQSPISKPSPLFSTPPPRSRIGFSPSSGARRAFSPTDGLAEAEQEERESNSNIPPLNKALLNLPDPDWEGDLDLEEVMTVYAEVRRLQKAHLIFTKEVARLENDLQAEKSRAHRTALILEQQQEDVIKELEACKKVRDAFKNEAKQLKAQQEKDHADLRRADEEKLEREKQIKQLRKETDNLRQLHNASKTQKVQDQAAVEKAQEELKKIQAKHKQLLERYEHEQIARTKLEDNLRVVQEEFEIQRQENEEKEELIVEQTGRIEVLTTDVERLEKHIQRQSVASTTFDAESDDVSSSGDSVEPDASDYVFPSRAGRNSSPRPPAEDNDTRLHRVRSATLTVDRLQVVDKVTRMNYTGVEVQTDLSISDEQTGEQFIYWVEAEDPAIAALNLLRHYSETGRQFVEAFETEATIEDLEQPESPQLPQEPEHEPEPEPKPSMEEKSVQVTAPEPEPPVLISRSAQTIPQVIPMATAATSTDSLPITPPMPQEEFPFPVRSRSNSARSQRRPSVPTIPEVVEAADPEPSTEPDQYPANLFTNYTSSSTATAASPEDTYTELISTTHAKRLRLAALSNKPLLTVDDREFIWDFIVEQSTHDRHLLSNIWTAAIKSEDAARAANFDSSLYKPNTNAPPLLHSPIAALANPLRMIFDAVFGNLDLTDYQAAATRGEKEVKDRLRAEILAEMSRSPEAVMAAVRTLEASVNDTPGHSTFSSAGEATPGNNNEHPQPSPAPTNATDSTPRQQTYPLPSETPKRAPVGTQAVLLRAGPKPSSVWSILSLVMWAVILFMAASNLHMYWYMKKDQGAWAVANDISGVGAGWRNGGSCYRVCSDGWGWRWKALVREWFIEEVGIRWPS
ncbi:hypothetical protein BZA77DRAFT_153827 [Pyronema omphalodes]|nr:hypothetical protein BZA77DRAFT_153827 [Pyronema omphalodes]